MDYLFRWLELRFLSGTQLALFSVFGNYGSVGDDPSKVVPTSSLGVEAGDAPACRSCGALIQMETATFAGTAAGRVGAPDACSRTWSSQCTAMAGSGRVIWGESGDWQPVALVRHGGYTTGPPNSDAKPVQDRYPWDRE